MCSRNKKTEHKNNQIQILNALSNSSFSKFNTRQIDVSIYSFFEIERALNENFIFDEAPLPISILSVGLSSAPCSEKTSIVTAKKLQMGKKVLFI